MLESKKLKFWRSSAVRARKNTSVQAAQKLFSLVGHWQFFVGNPPNIFKIDFNYRYLAIRLGNYEKIKGME